jgi:hypothetical protein
VIEPLFEHLSDEQRSFMELLLRNHQSAFGEANIQPLSHDCLFIPHLEKEFFLLFGM